MATLALREQAKLLQTVTDPKLQATLRELLKHLLHDQRQATKDSGCG